MTGPLCRDGFWVSPPAPTPGPPEDDGGGSPPPVTLRDLVEFVPKAPNAIMEPARWMLRDAPTNFVVTSETHVVTAPLLGVPTHLRFTPAGFRFDYGDGSPIRSTTTGGARWEDARLPEFSETATSHVFEKRGTYTVTVTALYTAEYSRDGTTWTAIDGEVGSPTTITGRTVTIDTVLVPGTCDEYPGRPGCPGWEPPDDPDDR